MALDETIDKTVLYTGPQDALGAAEAVLGDKYRLVRSEPVASAIATHFRTCSAFLDASLKVHIRKPLIQEAKSLQVVAVAATGYDHIDESALNERGIPLLSLRGQREVLRNLTPAAEHSWLLLMACARQLRAAHRHVLEGGWNRVDFPGIMLRGKTLGLIGCGRIGTWMSRYASAFEMEVIGFDPYLEDWPDTIRPVPKEELLREAHFVSLHVPLSDENPGLVDDDMIQQMKTGAVFVNTSRGALVDEEALVRALESGHLAAVGVDVLQGEPDIEQNVLYRYAQTNENVIITPHIGGFSPDAVREVVAFSARRIAHYLENGSA